MVATYEMRKIADLSMLKAVIEEINGLNKPNRFKDSEGKIRWIFRGDKKRDKSEPSIKSSLERFFCVEGIRRGEKRKQIEDELIREFKRAYHQYAYHLPKPDATVEWLSLMQHHGAPTRLVDFTYSPYVAAYFALEEPLEKENTSGTYIVWAINSIWANKKSLLALKKKHRNAPNSLGILAKPATDSPDLIKAQRVFFKRPFAKLAFPQNPFRLNERLRIQKGVFVLQGDLNSPFMENLSALTGTERGINVFQVELDRNMRGDLLRELHHMNITRTSLFPGLDGYAKSLGVHLPRLKGIVSG